MKDPVGVLLIKDNHETAVRVDKNSTYLNIVQEYEKKGYKVVKSAINEYGFTLLQGMAIEYNKMIKIVESWK